jgi:hypothetical protein
MKAPTPLGSAGILAGSGLWLPVPHPGNAKGLRGLVSGAGDAAQALVKRGVFFAELGR